MSNFSDESRKEALRRFLFCTVSDGDNDQGSGLLFAFKLLVPVYISLTITATLGNSLILAALHKDTSLHLPSKILLRTLAVTDLCVGIIGLPLCVIFIFSALFASWDLCRMAKILMYVFNTIFSCVSLLTLTAISVDRLLALLLRLRYRQVVTVKRVRAVVVLFWLSTSVTGVLTYVSDMNPYLIISGVCTINLLPLLISTYSYSRIFLTIRRQRQIQLRSSPLGLTASSGLNMERYKKTVHNALWVHLTLVACYLPSSVVMVLTAVRGFTSSVLLAQGWAFALVYLNSSLNPVLFCWKIKEVRRAVKEIMRQFRKVDTIVVVGNQQSYNNQ
ncbi:adenosine receptor A3-like [Oculina patagonica]